MECDHGSCCLAKGAVRGSTAGSRTKTLLPPHSSCPMCKSGPGDQLGFSAGMGEFWTLAVTTAPGSWSIWFS